MPEHIPRVRQAVILAAGEGQRLRPFTGLKPKVMIPISNKPILQYVVEALAQVGVTDLILVVGYRKEQVQDYFGSGEQFGVHISYAIQKQQIGTGHALKQARHLLGEGFLVLAGDNLIEPQTIAQFVQAHPNSILIKQQEETSKYGVVTLRDDRVEDIVEKPREPPSNLVNTGIYLLSQDIFSFLEEEVDLPGALRGMMAHEYVITAQETQGLWLDAVHPWDILRLNHEALGRLTAKVGGTIESGVHLRGPVSVGKDSVIRSGCYIVGPVVIGENCDIGPHVGIFPCSSIGDNVAVAPFTVVRNSVVHKNSSVGPASCLEDTVVDQGCTLGSHFLARSGEAEVRVDGELHRVKCGALIAEDCNFEGNVIVQPGVMVGDGVQVKAMKVLRENLPPRSVVM